MQYKLHANDEEIHHYLACLGLQMVIYANENDKCCKKYNSRLKENKNNIAARGGLKPTNVNLYSFNIHYHFCVFLCLNCNKYGNLPLRLSAVMLELKLPL